MKILFCKISAMKYYKGVYKDKPQNGGSYVQENGVGNEEYNFAPVILEDGEEYCLGFVETKTTQGDKRNELHIEKIQGCAASKNAQEVEDVLVVWCATSKDEEKSTKKTSIVGWYRNATVYRNYEQAEFDSGYIQDYNILAKKSDCVLLPENQRHKQLWQAPVARKWGYGFGQAMVWYAQDEKAKTYIEGLVKQIENYQGENWIDKSVDNP